VNVAGGLAPFITEFTGTFFLTLTFALTADLGSMSALAVGSMYMVMIFAGGHLSGGHFNPAVSFGVCVSGRMKRDRKWGLPGWLCALFYIPCQALGAFAAALAADNFLTDEGRLLGSPQIAENVDQMKALYVEAIFTFALVLVVLNCTASKANQGNSFYGLAIGFTVLAGMLAARPLTGGCLNPALGTALPIVAKRAVSDLWVFWVGPMIGGLVAGGYYALLVPR